VQSWWSWHGHLAERRWYRTCDADRDRAQTAYNRCVTRTDIVEVPPGPDRDHYLPLLRLADDSDAEIRGYHNAGALFGLLDADTGAPIGHVLAIWREAPGEVELKSVAIASEHRGRGLGAALIERVLSTLRDRGARRVLVGTSNASTDNLRFYQRVGFRLLRVERDYFSAAKGYGPDCVEDGIRVRDMVWMDRDL
jgi:ribosomal protein S18 acetylase RimI-like enzyme